ncbi:MOSC domain-containing protein [Candidatus Aerophobetes bacterium]|nr:MOSC domain-containing protein [Candidatus Aerophobetes bacterium]
MGEVFSVNLSSRKGISKSPAKEAFIREECGLEGDAHYGFQHRQVSLLSLEDIEKQNFRLERDGFTSFRLKPGDFAENITTRGIELFSLTIGDRLRVGSGVILEVTQIGKECHDLCEISKKIGKCIMPKKGIFAKVLKGGQVKEGDPISLLKADKK